MDLYSLLLCPPHLIVRLVTKVVLVALLHGGHRNDEKERNDTGSGADSGAGEQLDDGHAEEVEVGDALELFEEVLGQEGENGVARGADAVVGILEVLVRVIGDAAVPGVVSDEDRAPSRPLRFEAAAALQKAAHSCPGPEDQEKRKRRRRGGRTCGEKNRKVRLERSGR